MPVIKKTFGQDKYQAVYLVEETQDGMRLDQFIQLYMPSFSREMVKKKIKEGDIQIINRPGKTKSSSIVHYQDHVSMTVHKSIHEDEYWNGKKLELQIAPEIIFENNDMLVISKPPFMATHPTGRHLFNCATVYFEAINKKTVHSVHRLDRETSGVLVLAKNPKTAQELTAHFENDRVRKVYFFMARIKKSFNQQMTFTAKERLGTNEKGLKRVYINSYPEDSSEGKHALTYFEVLHIENGYALGMAYPQTGRQHQIRVHAMVHGLPLIGDKIYYGSFEMFQRFKDNIASEEEYELMELPRHALHSCAINIPYQNERQVFISHLPHDFKDWIKKKVTIPIDKIETQIKKSVENYFSSESK